MTTFAAAPEASTSGPGAAPGQVTVAVVVAISERPQRLEALYDGARHAFEGRAWNVEFVLVGEPWARDLLEPLREQRDAGEPLRLFLAGQAVGETALVRAGATLVNADVVVIMPAYHRVALSVLPELVQRVLDGADMAVARRWPRHDSFANRLQTRGFHALLRGLTGSSLSDVASGVRAMRPALLEEVPMYGDFGRFLPVLAQRSGYRVVEVDAEQHELDRPTRVHSPGVYLRRLLDVLGLFFLTRFTEKPLRFFGLLGSSASGAGFAVLLVLLFQKVLGKGIADRPMLLLGVLLVVVGIQAVALGLVGEIIVHLHAGRHKPYRVWDLDAD